MIRGSDAFERIIAGPHARTVRAQARKGNIPLGDLAVSAASLSISGDSSTITRRTLDLTVAATPDAIAWFHLPSLTIRVWVGVKPIGATGDSSVELGVHWGVSLNPNIDEDNGVITVSSPDLASRPASHSFLSPRSSTKGMTITQQLSALVVEATPWMGVRDETGDSTAVPSVTWTDSRSDAIVQLASSIGAETFFSPATPDGPAWVVRPERTLASLPDFTVKDGVNLSTLSESVDFSKAFNCIVATSDRGDSTTLKGVSTDTDPASPLNVMDCGYRVGRISSSLFTTKAQCRQAAYLARVRLAGYPASLSVDAALHPGVECGDLWHVQHDRKTYRVIPTSIDYDLMSGAMSATCRSATLPDPAEVS